MGATRSATPNFTRFFTFSDLLQTLLPECPRLIAATSVGVWKCARVCVRSAVFTCTCVWSGWEQKRTLITRGLRRRVRKERSFHLPAGPDPGGTTCQESFCVINTKSLKVSCWPGPEIRIQRAPAGGQGSRRHRSEAQIAVCHGGKTVKKHYCANYKPTGPLDPPSPPTYGHPSFTSATSLNSACS